MKKTILSLVSVLLMTAWTSCQESANTQNNAEEAKAEVSFDQLVHERFSCKRFDASKQLGQEQLDAILEAGRVAPTAKNLQEQRIYVVQSQEMLQKIDALCPCRNDAPTCLVVAYDKDNVFTYPNSTRTSGVEDATIVATHMLLAAQAQGVNSCWINFFDPQAMAEALGMPTNEEVVMMLDLGFAADGIAPMQSHFDRKDIAETVKVL